MTDRNTLSAMELARHKVLCDILFGAADGSLCEQLTGRALGRFSFCLLGFAGEGLAMPEVLRAAASLPQCRDAAVFAVSPCRIAVLRELATGKPANSKPDCLAGLLAALRLEFGQEAVLCANTVLGSGAAGLRQCYIDCDRALVASLAAARNTASAGDSSRSVKPVLVKALDYIVANFNAPLSLDDVAEHAFASPCYVSRLFVRELGMGFVDYLTAFRVENAKRLLRGTELKVFEVAELSGISDAHYFAKLFRKSTGLSPSEYREKQDW